MHFSECNPSLSDARLYYDSIISIPIKEEIKKKYLGKFWVPKVQDSFFSRLLSGNEKNGTDLWHYMLHVCAFLCMEGETGQWRELLQFTLSI